MSTEIKTNTIPLSISSNSSQKSSKVNAQNPDASNTQGAPVAATDTVSITSQVSRLQAIESQLAAQPAVNEAKVNDVKNAIADGSFKIDAQNVASKLISMESDVAVNS